MLPPPSLPTTTMLFHVLLALIQPCLGMYRSTFHIPLRKTPSESVAKILSPREFSEKNSMSSPPMAPLLLVWQWNPPVPHLPSPTYAPRPAVKLFICVHTKKLYAKACTTHAHRARQRRVGPEQQPRQSRTNTRPATRPSPLFLKKPRITTKPRLTSKIPLPRN